MYLHLSINQKEIDLGAAIYVVKTSRITIPKSLKACAPSPVKEDPCIGTIVRGFNAANFCKFASVRLVYGR